MQHFHELASIPVHNRAAGMTRVLSVNHLMVVWVDVKAGTHVAAHSHPNEQITWLMSGCMEYRIGDNPPHVCEAGTVVHIPPDVEHEVWYRDDCRYCEIFTPPRLDLYPAAAHDPYGFA